ncbi:alpha/beta hydrolase [Bisgaard Taxon 10/6]|uniref:RBBP9/YdeN family alpha/beta hydrolase n=1 Tax=Exercitatus varius TaxID=67857 RepID=UPI00294AA4F4|nr:alpha/beta fold hydrolase [Exercitatus varius]MDG2956094.1 alpha/beta hydrolase [Exercitatus varius]MDG2965227.1 alpha/beta hydrolase [Exercitatus varius]
MMNRRRFCLGLTGLLSATVMPFTACAADKQPIKAYIIHGYGATVHDHWFPWLHHKLESAGIKSVLVDLPDSLHPDFENWQSALAKQIGMLDENSVFIAHSLGTISLLHYLSRLRPQKVGGIILAAGFGQRIPGLSEINGFNLDAYIDHIKIDFAAVRAMARQIYCIISDNDPIVPPKSSERLAHQLHAHVYRVANAGHFLASDGFTELPVVWQAVEKCLIERHNGEKNV